MAIVVKLTGDLSDLEGKLKQAGIKVQDLGEKADKAGGHAGKLTGALGGVAKVAGGFVLAQGLLKAPGVLMGFADASRDLELQTKKASIVFGDQIDVVEKWSAQNATSMGLTERQATSLAAGMADLLIPMGMTREQAAKISTETLTLSGALSEWSGGQTSATEAAEILSKAYLGETDGLKGLGIAISAADVAARLAAKGQDELTGAAQQQAQALAIQELIMEKSTDAQTAFANGSDSAARKQAEMTAQVNQAKESIAVALGPAIAAVTTQLAEWVPKIIEVATAVGEWLMPKLAMFWEYIQKNLLPKLQELGEFFMKEVMPKILAFFDWIQPKLQELGGWVGEQFAKFREYYETDIKPALDNIIAGIKAIIDFVVEHWPEIEKVVKPVIEQVQLAVETAVAIIMGVLGILIDLIGGDFSGAWTKLQDLVDTVWTYIKESVGNAIELIKNLAPLMLEAGEALGGALMDGLKKALGAVKGFAGDVGQAVLSAVKGVVNQFVIDPINRSLEFSFDTHIPGVGKISVNPPDIPRLASGMWDVPGATGVDGFPALLAGGEMVLPENVAEPFRMFFSGAGGGGGGGNSITFPAAGDGTGGTDLTADQRRYIEQAMDTWVQILPKEIGDAIKVAFSAFQAGTLPLANMLNMLNNYMSLVPEAGTFTPSFTGPTASLIESAMGAGEGWAGGEMPESAGTMYGLYRAGVISEGQMWAWLKDHGYSADHLTYDDIFGGGSVGPPPSIYPSGPEGGSSLPTPTNPVLGGQGGTASGGGASTKPGGGGGDMDEGIAMILDESKKSNILLSKLIDIMKQPQAIDFMSRGDPKAFFNLYAPLIADALAQIYRRQGGWQPA